MYRSDFLGLESFFSIILWVGGLCVVMFFFIRNDLCVWNNFLADMETVTDTVTTRTGRQAFEALSIKTSVFQSKRSKLCQRFILFYFFISLHNELKEIVVCKKTVFRSVFFEDLIVNKYLHLLFIVIELILIILKKYMTFSSYLLNSIKKYFIILKLQISANNNYQPQCNI